MKLQLCSKTFLFCVLLNLCVGFNGRAQDTPIRRPGYNPVAEPALPRPLFFYKTIEFGFNLPPLYELSDSFHTGALADLSQVALDSLYDDGIRIKHLRVGWPFYKGFSSSEIIGILKRFIDVDNDGDRTGDYHILLCLSNYEFRQVDKFPCPPHELLLLHPSLTSTNQWPPRWINRSLDGYGQRLSEFVKQLEEAGILNNITFELGNEPDAKLYFWGTTCDYIEIVGRYHEVLSQWDRDQLCCGFTSTLLGGSDLASQTLSANRGKPSDCTTPALHASDSINKDPNAYIEFIYNNNQLFTHPDHHVTPSFHYYTYTMNNRGRFNVDQERIIGSHITEFNMVPNPGQYSSLRDKIDSPLFVSSFAGFLKFAYEYNTPTVYFQKLLDTSKDFDNGFFYPYIDVEPKISPKTSYKCLKLLLQHLGIQDGYHVEKVNVNGGSEKYLRISGGKPDPYPGVGLTQESAVEIAISRMKPVLIVAIKGEVPFDALKGEVHFPSKSNEFKDFNNILHYYYVEKNSAPPNTLKAFEFEGIEYPGDWILYSRLVPEHPMVEGCECPR